MRSLRLLAFAVCVCLASGLFAQMSRTGIRSRLQPVPNAVGWQNGTLVNTFDNDCLDLNGGFTADYIIGTYVAYSGDPNAGIPSAGQIYYTDVVVQRVSACQPVSVQPFLIPPANTALAISAANPIYCFFNGQPTSCSQNPPLQTSLSGATGYNLGIWNLNTSGASIEVQVPVVTNVPGAATLYARIDTADGWSNPSATPQKAFIVSSGGSTPTVGYPSPSAKLITDTTVSLYADIFSHFTAGTIYFDLGTDTSYADATSPFSLNNTYDSVEVYSDWTGLLPGTLYHWRARFSSASGTAYGIDQTFTTTGTVSAPLAPTSVSAEPAQGMINVTWSSMTGATSYEIYRRSAGSANYNLIGTSGTTIYRDTSAVANSAYLYRVRAHNPGGSSPDSRSDLATMMVFTDDPALTGTTIKVAHLIQLRAAVNGVRALAGLSAGTYTGVAASGLIVKAVHILELRSQFEAALGALGLPVSSWADIPATGTIIGRWHVQQLRDRLK